MRRILSAASLAAVLAGIAGPASAGGHYFPFYYDGSQEFHSRAVAGAAPNSEATFLYGVRCHYEYRVGYAPHAATRYRVEVCN